MNTTKAIVAGSKKIKFTDTATGEQKETFLHITMCGKQFSAEEPITQGNVVSLQEKKKGDINPKTNQPIKQDGWLLGFDLGGREQFTASKENMNLLD